MFTGLLVTLVVRETLVQQSSPINSLQPATEEKRYSS